MHLAWHNIIQTLQLQNRLALFLCETLYVWSIQWGPESTAYRPLRWFCPASNDKETLFLPCGTPMNPSCCCQHVKNCFLFWKDYLSSSSLRGDESAKLRFITPNVASTSEIPECTTHGYWFPNAVDSVANVCQCCSEASKVLTTQGKGMMYVWHRVTCVYELMFMMFRCNYQYLKGCLGVFGGQSH